MMEFDKTGFLNIYKEAGFTSHDVVAKLRGILHTKKIGHTGTLDPMATGVLPIAVGRATKTIELLSDHSKAYTAVMLLGTVTDTYDTTGEILQTSAVNVTEDDLRRVCGSFTGDIEQLPPMYSAKKVDGKRLYDLARAGVTVERKPASVHIASIHIQKIELPYVTFDVECSKGTYIRSLCHDIGEALGCGACMDALERTRAGSFLLRNVHRLSDVERAADEDRLAEIFLPVDAAFGEYSRVDVKEELTMQALNGTAIAKKDTVSQNEKADLYRLYLFDGRFLGLYTRKGEYFQVKKLCLLPDVYTK